MYLSVRIARNAIVYSKLSQDCIKVKKTFRSCSFLRYIATSSKIQGGERA